MSRSGIVLALKLTALVAVTVLLAIITVNAIRNPVENSGGRYTADFTDVSGLHVNGDVRVRGMRVGKIDDIELNGGETVTATVAFTLDSATELTDGARIAVKYQSLTGVRYLDLTPGPSGPRISHLGVEATRGSFDITELFNGLQPVLSTMRADEVDAFTANAIALIQGDGSGLEPMLESTRTLASHAKDRQQLMSALVENLGRINDALGGRAGYVLDFLQALTAPIDNAISVIDAFAKTAANGPALLAPIQSILSDLGITQDLDWEAMGGRYFDTASTFLSVLTMLPATASGLSGTIPSATGKRTCTNGRAAIPAEIALLINGSQVVLCRTR